MRTFKTYTWVGHDDDGQRQWTTAEAPREVLTVAALHAKLGEIMAQNDYASTLPVSILDMMPDDKYDATTPVWAGLVTDVEFDIAYEDQGVVCSLVSWPLRDGSPA